MTRLSRCLFTTLALGLLVQVANIERGSSRTSADDLPSTSGGAPQMIAAATADIGDGKRLYSERCAICHEAGGMSGPSLRGESARKNKAEAIAWIKNPRPPMPKLYPSPLSDKDVSDVAAYVETFAALPQAASSKITGGTAVAGNAAEGKQIYGKNCAACHGATGAEGGVGPSLKAERTRKDQAAAAAWIKDPKPPMPKLFPSPLNEKDVSDVAAYVETL